MSYLILITLIILIGGVVISRKSGNEKVKNHAKTISVYATAVLLFLLVLFTLALISYLRALEARDTIEQTKIDFSKEHEKLLSSVSSSQVIPLDDYYVIKYYGDNRDYGTSAAVKESHSLQIINTESLLLIPKTEENERIVKEYLAVYEEYENTDAGNGLANWLEWILGIKGLRTDK